MLDDTFFRLYLLATASMLDEMIWNTGKFDLNEEDPGENRFMFPKANGSAKQRVTGQSRLSCDPGLSMAGQPASFLFLAELT